MLSDLSISAMKTTVENSTRSFEAMNRIASDVGLRNLNLPGMSEWESECCPPKQKCPPHCILEIFRNAYPGEVIVVPFMVKNTCQTYKTYKVGVRELKNINGSPAPTQPQLDKQQVSLAPGQSELVKMYLDVRTYNPGESFATEIVIREKEYNQNICFNLSMKGFGDAPVARPMDEKKYKLKWLSWRSHFYCEPRSDSNNN
jgi:hypothetical protein